jgi:(p)ppGpp synthase/HD superfamily hydrolase
MTQTRDEMFLEAFEFAYKAHLGARRKGTDIPYIVHPMDVASTLMKNGAGAELIAAGLLHDVVEDADISLDEIEERFGPRVRELVKGASEPEELRDIQDKQASWRSRKQHTVEFIAGAEVEMKMLSCADKLSNIRDMTNDLVREGEAFWDRFNAPKEEQAWYYRGLLEAFGQGDGITSLPMYFEFRDCVKRLFGDI